MFDNKKLGAYIQFLRKSKGMTQSRLAEMLGLSPQAVSNWERGESMPDIALLTELARALGTTVDRILSAAEDFSEERYKAFREEEKEEVTEDSAKHGTTGVNNVPPAPAPDVNLGNLSQVIRDSVMGALSGLSEQFQPMVQTLKKDIEGVMGDIEDAVEEAEEAMKEARETSRHADRVIVHVKAKARSKEKNDDWHDIVAMAPFASEETLDRLVRDLDTAADAGKIAGLAPFLSESTVDMLVKKAIGEEGIDWHFLKMIAPFCDSLDDILVNCDMQFTLKELLPLAPFLEEETIDKLIRKQTEGS